MSLTISFIFLSEDFNKNITAQNDLFGFESCRNELWGNRKLKELGCTIIPKLKDNDLFIVQEELYELYKDCEIILENISEISCVTNYSSEFIRFRINNLLSFVEIALKNKEYLGINIS